MFWPKNRKRYEKLKSSFANLMYLVEDLEKSGFNGFLEVKFDHEQFYILMTQGAPIKVCLKDSSGKFSFETISVNEIYKKSLANLAYINVFDVDPVRLGLLINYLNAVPLYTNLSSEFTDFQRLTSKLSKDTLSGYLEVKFLDSSLEPVYLLYNRGKIVDIFRNEQPLGNDKGIIEGIRTELGKNEAFFNVYQVRGEKVKRPQVAEAQADADRGLDRPREEKEEATGETVRTELATGVMEKAGGAVAEEETENVEEIGITEGVEEEIEEIGIPSGAEEKNLSEEAEPERKESLEMGELTSGAKVSEEVSMGSEIKLEDLPITPYVEFVEALIQWVERSVDRRMGQGFFSKTFKKGLLNISDKYPFLDPFLAEFSYVNGRVHLSNEEIKVIEFLKGIYAAIDMIFEEMTERKRNEIRKSLRQNLREFDKRYHEEIEILRVRTLMPTLFH